MWPFRKPESVTGLAAYAANPERFIENQGKAYNTAGAEAGSKAHENAGRIHVSTELLIGLVFAAIFITVIWVRLFK